MTQKLKMGPGELWNATGVWVRFIIGTAAFVGACLALFAAFTTGRNVVDSHIDDRIDAKLKPLQSMMIFTMKKEDSTWDDYQKWIAQNDCTTATLQGLPCSK